MMMDPLTPCLVCGKVRKWHGFYRGSPVCEDCYAHRMCREGRAETVIIAGLFEMIAANASAKPEVLLTTLDGGPVLSGSPLYRADANGAATGYPVAYAIPVVREEQL